MRITVLKNGYLTQSVDLDTQLYITSSLIPYSLAIFTVDFDPSFTLRLKVKVTDLKEEINYYFF